MKTFIHDTLTSTQTTARQYLKTEDCPFVVFAHMQTSGYGKYGRVWQAFKGNFMATYTLNLSIEHYDFGKLPMLICIKLCKLLSALTHSENILTIKWPNDILLNKKKFCGILIEKIDNKFLIGIGMNLRLSPEEHSTPYPTTNVLHETGVLIEPDIMLTEMSAYFESFETTLTECDAAQLRQTYMTLLEGKGQNIKVVTRKETMFGVLQDINHDGALILNVDGATQLIYAADIFI